MDGSPGCCGAVTGGVGWLEVGLVLLSGDAVNEETRTALATWALLVLHWLLPGLFLEYPVYHTERRKSIKVLFQNGTAKF